jgi:general secretion pathway protein D
VASLTLPGGFAEGSTRPIFRKEVRIVADEVTNSLITLATRRDYQLILEVLQRIDVIPRQVVLEVMIAEIALGKNLEFGIRYAFAQGPLVSADTRNADSRDSIFANQPAGRDVAGYLGDAVRFPDGRAFAVITDREHFNIFLNALQTRTNVKMLSAPHVIAADNREAHILVGQQIPILTSTATAVTTGTAGTTINSVQYRDTGKILTILPQVNSKGLVNLQLRQEVSAVGSDSFGNTNSPSFTTREVETTMVVDDGATVVIGGIIDDQITHDRSGVPFLMDIPAVGWVFRSDTRNVTRTELLITITPYVIRNRDEAKVVTDQFSARIEGVTRLRQAMKRIRKSVGQQRAAEQADEEEPYPEPSQTFDEAPFDAP